MTEIIGPNELKLQISIATDKTVSELKQAVAAQSDVEADRQRLIYSGALMKAHMFLYIESISTGRVLKVSSFFDLEVKPLPTLDSGRRSIVGVQDSIRAHRSYGQRPG